MAVQVIRSKEEISQLKDNAIVGDIELVGSSVSFRGKGNVLYVPKSRYYDKVVLRKSVIRFDGDNSLVFVPPSNNAYSITLYLGNSSWFKMGSHTFINGELLCTCTEMTGIFIGDTCTFSYGISIKTSDVHFIYDSETHVRTNSSKSILIGDHVWVGENAHVFKGTQIGSGSVVGGFSIVSGKTIPSNAIWAGNPAREIRSGAFWSGRSSNLLTSESQVKFGRHEGGAVHLQP